MIRAVTFDCWGTLLTDRDFGPSNEVRVKALLDATDGRLTVEDARDLLERAWRAHHDEWVAGVQHGSPGMARFCVETLGLDPDGCQDRLCAAFEEAALAGDVAALDGAVETLALLREAGIRTALVCDTGFTPGRVVRRFMDDHGLLPHLEFLAFSNEVGVPKPHPKIFEAALGAVGADPEHAVHIGDLRRTDIAGALNLGMRTVRIRAITDDTSDPDLPEAHEVVDSHHEIPDALRRLGAELGSG